ncbi:hypothetical protein [Virgibacillus indicus]|uniref:hypothetical protein n=1 Tax=Virgibacillus indicus TaxID=2024554 RepID=UPI00197E1236|nr:hypothetical protein [Virgibacillus indicus]
MNIKKILFSLITVSFLSTLVLVAPVGAEETEVFDTKIDKVSKDEFIDKEGDKVQEKVYYNSEGKIVKVSVEKGEYAEPVSTDNSTKSYGSYYAVSRSSVTARFEAWAGAPQIRVYSNGFSDSYTNSSKSTKKSIDRIIVNTTLMMNASVEDQDSDSRTSSSFANASAKQQSFMIPTHSQYSRSSHTYHNSGTNSVYHSTEASRG